MSDNQINAMCMSPWTASGPAAIQCNVYVGQSNQCNVYVALDSLRPGGDSMQCVCRTIKSMQCVCRLGQPPARRRFNAMCMSDNQINAMCMSPWTASGPAAIQCNVY